MLPILSRDVGANVAQSFPEILPVLSLDKLQTNVEKSFLEMLPVLALDPDKSELFS